MSSSFQKCILLHNIRSVYNVGAIFRTADALGVSKIYLSGYTPTPLDRFGVPRNDFAKSAPGAEKSVPWVFVKSPSTLLKTLSKEGFSICAVEQDTRSIDYKKAPRKNKMIVLFGNEVRGLSPALLSKADVVIEIPMRGTKESLNVSVSAGIVLFKLFDR